jgi:hypothetical protein
LRLAELAVNSFGCIHSLAEVTEILLNILGKCAMLYDAKRAGEERANRRHETCSEDSEVSLLIDSGMEAWRTAKRSASLKRDQPRPAVKEQGSPAAA